MLVLRRTRPLFVTHTRERDTRRIFQSIFVPVQKTQEEIAIISLSVNLPAAKITNIGRNRRCAAVIASPSLEPGKSCFSSQLRSSHAKTPQRISTPKQQPSSKKASHAGSLHAAQTSRLSSNPLIQPICETDTGRT